MASQLVGLLKNQTKSWKKCIFSQGLLSSFLHLTESSKLLSSAFLDTFIGQSLK